MKSIDLLSNFNNQEIYFFLYLLLINLIAFTLYAIDKYKAKRNQWRISELTLIFLSLIGGGLGSILAMVIFKHKLSKKKFSIGIPILILMSNFLKLFILNFIK